MPDNIRQNTERNRFELETDGHLAVANYRLSGNVMTFTHTEVAPEVQGRGIASQLVRGALDSARAQGLKVVAGCDFVAAYLAKHPEYSDLSPTTRS